MGKTEDAAHTTGDVGVMALGVVNDNQDSLASTEKDYAPLGVTISAAVLNYHTGRTDRDVNGDNNNYVTKYYTNAGAVTDGIIWSPAAGKRWHVVSLMVQTSDASTITIEDDLTAGDSPVIKGEYAANSGFTMHYGAEYPMASSEDAADLIITTTAGNVYVTATGYEI